MSSVFLTEIEFDNSAAVTESISVQVATSDDQTDVWNNVLEQDAVELTDHSPAEVDARAPVADFSSGASMQNQIVPALLCLFHAEQLCFSSIFSHGNLDRSVAPRYATPCAFHREEKILQFAGVCGFA